MPPRRCERAVSSTWRRLPLSDTSPLHLRRTLCGGQCFRWTMTDFGTFVGVVQDRAYELRPVSMDVRGNSGIEFRRLGEAPNTPTARTRARAPRSHPSPLTDEVILSAYLGLDVDVPAHWERWAVENPHRQHPLVRFLLNDLGGTPSATPMEKQKAAHSQTERLPFPMMRVLRQDVHQTVFEFLCSQNNHMKRITSLVQTLCTVCGDHICNYNLKTGEAEHGTTPAGGVVDAHLVPLHVFPTVDQLETLTEPSLRALGFGYRAKYVVGATALIKAARTQAPVGRGDNAKPPTTSTWSQHAQSCGEPFYRTLLTELGAAPSTPKGVLLQQQVAREQLQSLPGVGRKVADCVLLFALGQHDIVPVDTHMAQVAVRYLAPTVVAGRKRARSDEGTAWEAVLRTWRSKQEAKLPERSAPKKGAPKTRAIPAAQPHKVPTPALQDIHHDAIQQGFRELFGPYCGWAHCNIFFTVSSAS